MKFGEFDLASAEGAILAHSRKIKDGVIKKGTTLTADHLAALSVAGYKNILAAMLEPGDVPENEAAAALAAALCGEGLMARGAATGRANLHATTNGIAIVDHDRIHRINMLDERITIATLRPYAAAVPRQLAATIKIIPYAVPDFVLERTIEVAKHTGPPLSIASFKPMRCALLMTRLSPDDDRLLDKGRRATEARLARFGDTLCTAMTVDHTALDIAAALGALEATGCDLILVLSASAIVDRGDIVPSALEAAGGRIDQFGMPVDPGNLLLLGTLGKARVVGIPGCARSPALNGFDWVLERLHAGLKVATRDISRMGVGGLLKEIASRPQPRDEAASASDLARNKPRFHTLILAAGQSRRMGAKNKLLEDLDGKPLVAHIADAAVAAGAGDISVITGHEAGRVEQALEGRGLAFVHNPAYSSGLASSLKAGLSSLPDGIDAVLVCLGDMPLVSAAQMSQMFEAFTAADPGSICVPVRNGKTGNPVLWPRAYFGEILEIEGDVGARTLVGLHADNVVEVPFEDDAAFIDVDNQQMLDALKKRD